MYLKAQTVWRRLSNSSDFITRDWILKAMPDLTGTAVRADLWINYVEDPATCFRGFWCWTGSSLVLWNDCLLLLVLCLTAGLV